MLLRGAGRRASTCIFILRSKSRSRSRFSLCQFVLATQSQLQAWDILHKHRELTESIPHTAYVVSCSVHWSNYIGMNGVQLFLKVYPLAAPPLIQPYLENTTCHSQVLSPSEEFPPRVVFAHWLLSRLLWPVGKGEWKTLDDVCGEAWQSSKHQSNVLTLCVLFIESH